MHASITEAGFLPQVKIRANDGQSLVSSINSISLKERSPVTVDKTGGAIATSEQHNLYPIKGDFASVWLHLIYTTTRLIQIPFGYVFWALEQRLSTLEVAILTLDQAND